MPLRMRKKPSADGTKLFCDLLLSAPKAVPEALGIFLELQKHYKVVLDSLCFRFIWSQSEEKEKQRLMELIHLIKLKTCRSLNIDNCLLTEYIWKNIAQC